MLLLVVFSPSYPEKWLPFLPKGTALPPLEDVIDAPKANLGVIVLQVCGVETTVFLSLSGKTIKKSYFLTGTYPAGFNWARQKDVIYVRRCW